MQGRRDFMKTAWTLAVCSCPAAALLAQDQGAAPSQQTQVDAGILQRELAAAEQRFAYLLEAMDDLLGKKTRIKVMETVDRRCVNHSMELAEKFKGNAKDYLDEIQKQWVSRG